MYVYYICHIKLDGLGISLLFALTVYAIYERRLRLAYLVLHIMRNYLM